jgi:DNA-3-methyladenine glycosylase II
MKSYQSVEDLETAIRFLVGCEPRFAAVHKAHGTPSLRKVRDGMEALLMIVTEQFLSLGAAAAIWQRVFNAVQPFTPESLGAVGAEQLKELGLSTAKVKTFHAVAAAAQAKTLDFDQLATLTDTEVRTVLCALPGIGPWTADIYLLSALARPDAWPAGDLALQLAAQNLLQLTSRPTPTEMIGLAEGWRPHRIETSLNSARIRPEFGMNRRQIRPFTELMQPI